MNKKDKQNIMYSHLASPAFIDSTGLTSINKPRKHGWFLKLDTVFIDSVS